MSMSSKRYEAMFIVKMEMHIKLKKLEDEDATLLLASRLEDNAFDVYLQLSTNNRKDIARIKLELCKQYESGNRNREDTLYLLASYQRNEVETAPDFAYRISELV